MVVCSCRGRGLPAASFRGRRGKNHFKNHSGGTALRTSAPRLVYCRSLSLLLALGCLLLRCHWIGPPFDCVIVGGRLPRGYPHTTFFTFLLLGIGGNFKKLERIRGTAGRNTDSLRIQGSRRVILGCKRGER